MKHTAGLRLVDAEGTMAHSAAMRANIRNIDEGLWRRFKAAALLRGVSLSTALQAALKQWIGE